MEGLRKTTKILEIRTLDMLTSRESYRHSDLVGVLYVCVCMYVCMLVYMCAHTDA